MTVVREPSLAEQRQSICGQLQAQRRLIAQRLAPAADVHGRYPRSMTMRLLIHRRELLALAVGERLPGPIPVILALVRLLRSVAAVNAGRSLAGPRLEDHKALVKNSSADSRHRLSVQR